MHHRDEIRAQLRRLQALLQQCGEPHVELLTNALVSNELWGGAGSIADQGGMNLDRKDRRQIEHALAALGEEQIRFGKVNVRTASWVAAFRQWERDGI